MAELRAHGITLEAPSGFEARIFRRPEAGGLTATSADDPSGPPGAPGPPGERTYAVTQVSTIPLPVDTGDFASGAVELLSDDDVLVVLLEYGPEAVGQPLFARQGMPRSLAPEQFHPQTLQRRLPGQAGAQVFFTEQQRAFCLYAVLGSYARTSQLAPKVDAVLASVRIEAT